MVIRKTNSGEIADSKPCSHCLSAIRKLGIRHIIYSDDDGELVKTTPKELSSSRPSTGFRVFDNMLRDEIGDKY